ncbi:MAG: UvrD-helicase domain-containing protein [Mycoplasma sp.]
MIKTKEQIKIIESNNTFNFIMAGAGCGKTSTLIELLKENGSNSFNYCTFTNEVINEIISRVGKINRNLDKLTLKSCVYNFNSAGKRIFTNSNNITIDSLEFKRLFFIKLETLCDQKFDEPTIENFWNAICNYKRTYAKIKFTGENPWLDENNEAITLSIFNEIWSKEKVCEFVDMEIWYTDSILRENNTSFDSLRYFLVDEFQDLDINKFYILKIIIKNMMDKNSNVKIFFVGDYNQQIYSWREIEKINYFQEMMDYCRTFKKDVGIFSLSKCFRCDNRIIYRLNELLQWNKDLGFGYKPMSLNDKFIEKEDYIKTIIHEYDKIEEHIIEHLKGYENKDTLIITRSNSGVEEIQNILFKNKVPYKILGSASKRFFEWHAYSQFLLPFYYIDKSKEEDIVVPVCLLEKIYDFAVSNKNKVVLWNRITELCNSIPLNDYLFRDGDIIKVFKIFRKNEEESEIIHILDEMKKHISKTMDEIQNDGFERRFEKINSTKIVDFWYKMMKDDYSNWLVDIYSSKNLVGISTIHSSKGLEASNVIVCHNNSSNFNMTEEEVRLNYVAFSRSTDRLILLSSKPNDFFNFMHRK